MIDEKKLIEEQLQLLNWKLFTVDEEDNFNCDLPKHAQSILVSDGKYVWEDVFIEDGKDSHLYLEDEIIGLWWISLKDIPRPKPESWKGK